MDVDLCLHSRSLCLQKPKNENQDVYISLKYDFFFIKKQNKMNLLNITKQERIHTYSCCSLLNKSEFPWQCKNRNCLGILACTNLPVMIYRYRYRYGEREGVEERETLLTLMMGWLDLNLLGGRGCEHYWETNAPCGDDYAQLHCYLDDQDRLHERFCFSGVGLEFITSNGKG